MVAKRKLFADDDDYVPYVSEVVEKRPRPDDDDDCKSVDIVEVHDYIVYTHVLNMPMQAWDDMLKMVIEHGFIVVHGAITTQKYGSFGVIQNRVSASIEELVFKLSFQFPSVHYADKLI